MKTIPLGPTILTLSVHAGPAAPTALADCTGSGGLKLFIPWSGPGIRKVTVAGSELCVQQVCWSCAPDSSAITFDDLKIGTLVTSQYEPLGTVFGQARSPAHIVDASPPGTASGEQALFAWACASRATPRRRRRCFAALTPGRTSWSAPRSSR